MTALTAALRTVLAGLLLALTVARPAVATDWTDIWWNPAESGWGVNFVQSNSFIFATFFVYGTGNQPMWYAGQMTVDNNGTWSGELYSTTGTYLGIPWNTNDRSVAQVGTVTFTPATSYSGTLQYNVGTVNVTKTIQRQVLTAIPLGGNYAGAFLSVFSNCNDSSLNGPVTVFVNVQAVQTPSSTNLKLYFQDVSNNTTCLQEGAYTQDGQLYRIPGASYTCGSSFSATANVSQIKATNQGIEWQWVSTVGSQFPGCVENGYLSAVLK